MALETIIAHKRTEVAARKSATPLSELTRGLNPSTRSLADALRKPGTRFILECKKASPSRGVIRADFDLSAIVRTYAHYADAVSVLADERFFHGSLTDVQQVSKTIPLPVLCKEFILEPYQVFEARRFGADAVLLMMSVLSDDGFRACFEAAACLQLDALTEVHDEAELDRALSLGAEIIGINNRDLKTLSTDLAVSRQLAPKVPADKIVVIESGISSHGEVRALTGLCHGFLVGSALMGAPDLERACRELVYGRVKVCGLTSPEHARSAFGAGAVFGGLIFAAESPRCVSIAAAEAIRSAAPLDFVGVFVNEDIEAVARIAAALHLFAVQLHGEETSEYMGALSKRLPHDCEIWKTLRIGETAPDLGATRSDRVVLDTASTEARGGTGRPFDWSLLQGLDLSRVVLGGGLNPMNAASAAQMDPFALDVNSGVETAPGVKSPALLSELFAALRG